MKIDRNKVRQAQQQKMTLGELVRAKAYKAMEGEVPLDAVFVRAKGGVRMFARFLRPDGHIRTVEDVPARSERASPFQIGDVVSLKSGGFPMTVIGAHDQCDGTWNVNVAWTGYSDISDRSFPATCLIAVPIDQLRARRPQTIAGAVSRNLDDDIPF